MSERKTAPKVSVILPVYNGEKTVGPAIWSILNQTFRDFELIVVDDGSIDSTLKTVKAFAEARIKVIAAPHAGRSAARNSAASCARGRYLAMIDADDESYPERLERQVGFMDGHPEVALCGAWAHWVEPSGKKIEWRQPHEPESVRKNLLRSNPFIQCTVMVRKDVF